jgi:sucrose phosphorylase
MELAVSRFVASQAIALSLKGLPAFYYHSFLGSGNYHEGVEKTGRYRAINRERLNLPALREELDTPGTRRNLVYRSLARLLRARQGRAAFHPLGSQRVLDLDPGIFAVERASPKGDQTVLSLVNVTPGPVRVRLHPAWRRDILTEKTVSRELPSRELLLRPYEVFLLER